MVLTTAELTLLGLLVEAPGHGYDLERVIEERGMRRWSDIGRSSIYYVLGRLEGRGLIRVREHGTGSRSRRVFEATADGEREAALEVRARIADSASAPPPILVGLGNLTLLGDGEYVEMLRGRLDSLETRIASVALAEREGGVLPLAAREVFSFSLALLEAERSWLTARVGETRG